MTSTTNTSPVDPNTTNRDLDVLFIMPPYRLVPPFEYQMLDPPRSLALLATILRDDGYSVEILDSSVTHMSYEDIGEEVARRRPNVNLCPPPHCAMMARS